MLFLSTYNLFFLAVLTHDNDNDKRKKLKIEKINYIEKNI